MSDPPGRPRARLDRDTVKRTRWGASGTWVYEYPVGRSELPEPLFQVDLPENARQLVAVHNELLDMLVRVHGICEEAISEIGDGHSSHWDPTMRHGAGCETCHQQSTRRTQLRLALTTALAPSPAHPADAQSLIPERDAARAALTRVEALCDVVRQLQRPDPDTGDRVVSFFALLDAIEPDDAALAVPEPGEQPKETQQ